MKKLIGLIVALTIVLAMVACASTPAQNQPVSGLPDIVRNARRGAPEGALIGVGSFHVGNNPAMMNQARTMAENRARLAIARIMDTMVRGMITDYTVSNELDPGAAISFQENISQSLTQARLQGVSVIDEDLVDGTYYVVAALNRADASREIASAADAAARLAIPAMAAFNALDRMDAAFNTPTAQNPLLVDSD